MNNITCVKIRFSSQYKFDVINGSKILDDVYSRAGMIMIHPTKGFITFNIYDINNMHDEGVEIRSAYVSSNHLKLAPNEKFGNYLVDYKGKTDPDKIRDFKNKTKIGYVYGSYIPMAATEYGEQVTYEGKVKNLFGIYF